MPVSAVNSVNSGAINSSLRPEYMVIDFVSSPDEVAEGDSLAQPLSNTAAIAIRPRPRNLVFFNLSLLLNYATKRLHN
jgi:hypothetical protein